MGKIEFGVINMDCSSCVEVIRRKLKTVAGVSGVDIDLKRKKVAVQTDNPNLCQEDLTCVVEDLGYKVQTR
jgi:copper chaperone CopZ